MADLEYVGNELETFAHARNWKAYLRDMMAPHIHGDVLEVGAGIGATMQALRRGTEKSWTCLEPDPGMGQTLREQVAASAIPASVITGTLDDVPQGTRYDTILYVDVLEHIERDGEELARAAGLLRAGGRVVVLSPAHQFLYTPFDARIGHFRRYNRRALFALTPPSLEVQRVVYMDSVGMLLSAGNRLLLQSDMPTLGQVLTWDRWFVPISRRVDPLLGRRVGKSILAVWQKPAPG